MNGVDITQSDLDLANGEIRAGPCRAAGGVKAAGPGRVHHRDAAICQRPAEGDKKLASERDFEKLVLPTGASARRRATPTTTRRSSSISDAVVRGIYDDKVKGLAPQEEVQARHILVETEEKAKSLADEIAKGADFGGLAKEHSKDAGSKGDGGMLGYFARGQMVAPFEEAASSSRPASFRSR